MIGVEVKNRSQVGRRDASGLLRLSKALGPEWIGGLVVHRGEDLLPPRARPLGRARASALLIACQPVTLPSMTLRPLRWLFFYDCIYPESLGGVEHRNHELARELGRNGHEVVLSGWAEAPGEPHPRVRVAPVAKASRRYLARGRRSGIEALTLASQVGRIPLDGIDIVETANIPYLHLPLLARRCRRRRIPLLVTWHEHWGTYWKQHRPPGRFGPGMWRFYALCERLSLRFGTQAVAVSKLTADRVARVRGEAVEVVPNGIPYERIRALAAEADAAAPPLVYAGRLIPEKRIDLLLDATARLAATEIGRRLGTERGPLLRIIGGGPAAQDIRARISRLGLGGDRRLRGTSGPERGRLARGRWRRNRGAALGAGGLRPVPARGDGRGRTRGPLLVTQQRGVRTRARRPGWLGGRRRCRETRSPPGAAARHALRTRRDGPLRDGAGRRLRLGEGRQPGDRKRKRTGAARASLSHPPGLTNCCKVSAVVGTVLQVEVSPGELIDKITILEIKAERISDPDKLTNVHRELQSLTATRKEALDTSPELDEFTAELRRINEQLWEIEDDIRDCERKRDFGERFVELARAGLPDERPPRHRQTKHQRAAGLRAR